MTWQLIETAPKDGTPILAFRSGCKIPRQDRVIVWYSDLFATWIAVNGCECPGVTHWHSEPLPEPPKEQS